MAVPARNDRTAVAARTESGQLCTVTVQRDPVGLDLLRYAGSETTAADLRQRSSSCSSSLCRCAAAPRFRTRPRKAMRAHWW